MARKATITKEMILDTALKILIRDGYEAVNIKTIAQELNCSTQPVVWHFSNMEDLRISLAAYAEEYASEKAQSSGKKAESRFEMLGNAYVRMALHEPNLFKYLYLGGSPLGKKYRMNDILAGDTNKKLIAALAEELDLTTEQAFRCVRDTIIYVHGITTMVATGVFKASKKELMKLINDAADGYVRRERG